MKRVLVFLILTIVLEASIGFANTHYVSQTGSSTYPYTSWATAADSIGKAVAAADIWDTVRVGSGTYREDVVLKKGLSFIGSGWDSTIIDGTGLGQVLINSADSCLIQDFYLNVRETDGAGKDGFGISCVDTFENSDVFSIIQRNKITTPSCCAVGIWVSGSKSIIKDNIIFGENIEKAVIADWFGSSLILNNYFDKTEIWSAFSTLFIFNNIFDLRNAPQNGFPLTVDYGDTVVVKNNLFLIRKGYGVQLSNFWGPVDTLENNTIIGWENQYFPGVEVAESILYRNNIVTGFYAGFSAYDPQPYPDCIISYNDVWGNVKNYYLVNPDTGNISLDPMFVDPDSDFHLQKYSPCIDAGDPDVLDKDGTRSDIGAYGGLLGETYAYLDYPPQAPDSLSASFDSVVITLSWKPNTEADLSHYTVYKDTLFGFVPDSSKIAGSVSKDSSDFHDNDWIYGQTYYYRVCAWDLTAHQSSYSDELMIKATDVPWSDETEVEIKKYSLSQNYPNPFNPVTTICYSIPELGPKPAKVDIMIYNLLGERIRTLVSDYRYPGEYRVMWDGRDDKGEAVASGIYFYRMLIWEREFIKAKKMILVK
jgi:hypothetical protein